MDLTSYRASSSEQERISSLISMIPERFDSGLDIGARDGYISLLMADRGERVVALDLSQPKIFHHKIQCIQGDVTRLQFPDDAFDIVVCVEVLEHVPPTLLDDACKEIVRVSKKWVLIGVPFNQDTRFGATHCSSCGRTNPPWGHVNVFSKLDLSDLFAPLPAISTQFVGATRARTNTISNILMEYAGHPYGTYVQEEPCTFCGARIIYMDHRSMLQKVSTRLAHMLVSVQQRFASIRPMWMHVLFEKSADAQA